MIRRLAKCIREYKKYVILTPLFVALEVLVDCLIPLVISKLIDNGIDKGDMSYILKSGAVMVFLACLGLLFGAMAGRSSAIASAGFGKNLRHDIFHKIQSFSFSNIDKFSTGGLVTRLTTDVTNVQMSFMMLLRVAVRSPISLVFSFAMAFSISRKLSLIFLGAIPVLAFALFFIATKVHPIMERVFSTYDKLNNIVQENLHGIRVVKSFVREEHETEKFNKVSASIYKDFQRPRRS